MMTIRVTRYHFKSVNRWASAIAVFFCGLSAGIAWAGHSPYVLWHAAVFIVVTVSAAVTWWQTRA